MSNEDIRDRLKREGDVWSEHQRARDAMRDAADRVGHRHVRNIEVVVLAIRSIIIVGIAAALVWLVQVVNQ